MDLDDQDVGNYIYDQIGNLIKDDSENMSIKWNVSGKVKEMNKSNDTILTMSYGPLGNRVMKRLDDNLANKTDYTFYILDATGNVMSTYITDKNPSLTSDIKLQSAYVYGSSRIAEERIDKSMQELSTMQNFNNDEWSSNRNRGSKYYELTEHRNNCLLYTSPSPRDRG